MNFSYLLEYVELLECFLARFGFIRGKERAYYAVVSFRWSGADDYAHLVSVRYSGSALICRHGCHPDPSLLWRLLRVRATQLRRRVVRHEAS